MLAGGPNVAIDDVQQLRATGDAANLVFTVTRSGRLHRSSTVDFATSSGSAPHGEDFQPISGTLNFAWGETSKTITVPVYGDTTVKPDETFFVDLTIINNGKFGDSHGVGTISNDDAGRPSISIEDVSVVRGKQTVFIRSKLPTK